MADDEIKIKIALDAKSAAEQARALHTEFEKLTGDSKLADAAVKKYNETLAANATEQKKAGEAAKKAGDEIAEAARKAGDAAKRASEAQAQLREDVSKTFARGIGGGELAERLTHINAGLAQMGDAGLSSSEKLKATAGTLGQVARLVAPMISQVAQLAAAFVALAASGEAQGRALGALGDRMDAVSAATNGTVTAMTALHDANALFDAGLDANAAQLAAAERAARDYARIYGGTVPEAMTRLESAITSNSAPALARFGLSADVATDSGHRLEHQLNTLSVETSGTRVSAQTLAEWWERLGTGGSALGGQVARLVENVVSFYVAIYRWVPVIGQVINIVQNAGRAMQGMADALNVVNNFLDGGSGSGGGSGHSMTRGLAAAKSGTEQLTDKLTTAERKFREVGDGTAMLATRIRGTSAAAIELKGALEDLNSTSVNWTARAGESVASYRARIGSEAANAIQAGRSQRDMQRQVAGDLRRVGAGSGTEINSALGISAGSAGSASRRDPWANYNRWATLLGSGDTTHDAQQAAVNAAGFNTAIEQGEGRMSWAQQQAAAARNYEAIARQQHANEGTVRGASDRINEAVGDNSLGGQMRSQFGIVRDEQTHMLRQTETFSQQFAGTLGGAFNTVSGAIKNHIAALIEGRETAGEALKAIVHETLMSLAQEAAIKAIFNTATGFAALASYQYPQAAAAFTAAGVYAAVAVAAGVGAYATNPTQVAQSAGAGGGPPRSPSVGGGRGASDSVGGGNTTILISGDVFAGTQFQDFLQRNQRQSSRRGLPGT